MPVRIAVFASGGGSNLQALIDRFQRDPDAPAKVELVIGSRAGIAALERADRAGIASVVVGAGEGEELEIATQLAAHRIELIVLAGYLRRVPDGIIDSFRGRILNVHPALLPGFGGKGMYGIRVHQAVLDAGAKVSGATVHLVDEVYDRGPILAQWPVPVLADDTAETLAERVLRAEHLLLPAAVEAFANAGPPDALSDPLSFELSARPAPSPQAVSRLAAATCKPVP